MKAIAALQRTVLGLHYNSYTYRKRLYQVLQSRKNKLPPGTGRAARLDVPHASGHLFGVMDDRRIRRSP